MTTLARARRLASTVDGRLGPASIGAGVFLLVAVAAIVVSITTKHVLTAWLPNIATSALAVALTITFVQWIVRAEDERRLRPRTEPLMRDLGGDFRSLVLVIAMDYAETHAGTFQPLPSDALALIDLWLSGADTEDRARHIEDDGRPLLFGEARDFAADLEEYRARDAAVMPTEIVAALDEFGWHATTAARYFDYATGKSSADREHWERTGLKTIVAGARGFAVVLRDYAPAWLALDDEMIGGVTEYRRTLSPPADE